MSDIGIILKSLEFIENHLTHVVSVADIAASVSYSLYHFSRTFSRITRHTPYDYLMRRRLSEATRCLLETERKIIDIAFEYQFNAPETFSRAFKRVYHQQPRQVKAYKNIDHRLLITKPTLDYLDFINSFALMPTLESLPAMRIAGIASQIDSCNYEKGISSLWQRFVQQVTLCKSSLVFTNRTGIKITFPSSATDQSMYLAGSILPDDEAAPSFSIQKDIPAQDYACFEIPHHPQATRYIRKYVYQRINKCRKINFPQASNV